MPGRALVVAPWRQLLPANAEAEGLLRRVVRIVRWWGRGANWRGVAGLRPGAWHGVFAHPLLVEARHCSASIPGALFRLTGAESALVLALWRQLSMEEGAERLGISIHTANTQLQAVFAKTGCSSQAERLVLLGRMEDTERKL